eukprot:gene6058-7546_t
MVVLTFIRHGETDFNKYGILQGHLNIPLNSKGKHQAQVVGEKLSNGLPVNLIISSDLDRAYETASIIQSKLVHKYRPPIISTQLLRERYLGKLEGVDLRQFMVNWEELPEPKKLIDIQKILSQKSNINSILSNPNFISSNNNNNNESNITKQQQDFEENLSSSTSSINNSPRSTSSLSSISSISSGSSALNTESLESCLSSSQSSTFSNLSSISSSPPPPPNIKLSSNILKHLPQKELKMESKSKLIHRAKDAFQFILKQVPSKFLQLRNNSDISSSTTTSGTTSLKSSSGYDILNDFHILVVSHSVMLRTILSLLLCRKTTPFFCNSSTFEPVTQSEVSSLLNFKWIKFELKNASMMRTSFSVIEKKSKDIVKRHPRGEIVFYPESPFEQNDDDVNSSKENDNNNINI